MVRTLIRTLFFAAISWPIVAMGQSNLVDGQVRGDAGGPMIQLDATFGYSQLEEDDFLRLDTGLAVQLGELAFAVHAPVHLRVADREPLSDNTIREEDWDETGDYFRIVRFLQYGNREKPDPFFVRAGELVDVSLGHRSVVDRYYNVVDTNHHKLGFQGEVEMNYGGMEMFLDHVAPPELVGIRGYVRPFTFFDAPDIMKRLSSGLVYVSDYSAPLSLRAGGGDLRANSTGVVSLYGWDVDWSVIELDVFEWIPYFDVMALDASGMGLHGGNFMNFYLSDSFSVTTQLEWRYASKGYQPGYISSLYEIEKWSFVGASGTRGPKLSQVRRDPNRQDRQGFYGGLDFHFSSFLSLGGTYEDYEGPNNSNLTLRVQTPYISMFKFAAFYAKRNFEGSDQMLNLRDTLLITQTRVQVIGPLFVSAEYAHTFVESGEDGYTGTDNTHFGIGAEFTF